MENRQCYEKVPSILIGLLTYCKQLKKADIKFKDSFEMRKDEYKH